MKKQYTRKQIVEAIEYWQNVLSQMNESKSSLLNAFIKEFGEDIVFDKICNLDLTQPIAVKIFQILDKSFFNNKLSKISNLKLFVGNSIELNPLVQKEYVHNNDFDISSRFAVFQPEYDFRVFNGQLKINAKNMEFLLMLSKE